MKTANPKKEKKHEVSFEEIDWILRKEYNYTHNRNAKAFKILEAMAMEIREKRG